MNYELFISDHQSYLDEGLSDRANNPVKPDAWICTGVEEMAETTVEYRNIDGSHKLMLF